MKIYSVVDKKSGRYSQPVFAEDDVSAKRIFLSFAISNQFWKDFELTCVGFFYSTLDEYQLAYENPLSVGKLDFVPIVGCLPVVIPVSDEEVDIARRDYAKMVKGDKS